ncbi:MAG: sulfur oxidation c-type cytochrome SoxX [Candidatus Thiodiazotropha sp.]
MIGNTQKWIGMAGAIGIVASQFLIAPAVLAADADALEAGKELAFDRKKGNCLACHNIQGAPSPGNIAPALVAMQSRYANKEALYKQVWDPTTANPESTMPPFGKHEILSEAEMKKVVDYIWSL